MAVSLTKGQNISLTKEAPGLKNLYIGLGWDVKVGDGADFDLDAACFLLNKNGKTRNIKDFVFYNNLDCVGGAVELKGDNRTGTGEGDDETICVLLDKLDQDVEKIEIVVSIYDGEKRKQNFGQVNNAYIHVVDDDTKTEIARYDLTEDASTYCAIIIGELYRHNGEWKFKALSTGFTHGLDEIASLYVD